MKEQDLYSISKQDYRGAVSFWTKEGFKEDDRNINRERFNKNECFHKVKELRKGLSKSDKKLINVF